MKGSGQGKKKRQETMGSIIGVVDVLEAVDLP